MGLTFARAPLVERGKRPTSTQMAALSQAAIERLLSGVGDWAWRVAWYIVNLWRQPRNPDSTGFKFAPQLEYFDILGAIPPASQIEWPIADPGDPEGANLACVGMALAKGHPGVVSDADRYLDLPLRVNGHTPATKEEFWQLGKEQRGGIDPSTRNKAWPAGVVAEAWMRIVTPYWSPHGKSYGGYLPTPDVGTTAAIYPGECGDDQDTGAFVINFKRKFTALRTDVTVPPHHGSLSYVNGYPVITYAGGCPCWTTYNAAGHVEGIYKAGRSYLVFVTKTAGVCNDMDVDRFPVDDWIEGPYTGFGELMHTDGGHLNRAVNAFATDFRGSATQRAKDNFNIIPIAWPAQEFYGRQYVLAPARGVESQGAITVVYPQVNWGGATSHPAGTLGTFVAGGTTHSCAAGFVLAGVFAKAKELLNGVMLDVFDGDTLLTALKLMPDENGDAEDMVWFQDAQRRQNLRFRLRDTAYLQTAAGYIQAEAAELEEMQPNYWDAAMLCRVAAAGNGQFVEGRGIDFSDSRKVGLQLLRTGCATGNWPVDATPAVNTNALYDAARRFTNNCLRILARRQFVAYEVDSKGRSILYVRRIAYGLDHSNVDLLDGLAPPSAAVSSGNILEGEVYVVESANGLGRVTYDGKLYVPNQKLTRTTKREFSTTGDALVYVFDGIRHTALKRGWTNQWCAFIELKRYHNSETSIWKPAAYGDYWPFCDRCHFYGSGNDRNFIRFISFNYRVEVDGTTGAMTRLPPRVMASLFAPESPPGYRYLEGSNVSQYHDNTRFRPSCRVYEPPVLLESATVFDRANGVIKLTFNKRFHAHPNAPATWSQTPPTWASGAPKPQSVLDLEAEIQDPDGYRTIDNGLRAYAVKEANSHWECPVAGEGDEGHLAYWSGQQPFGACLPTVFLIALPQKPYNDGNDLQDQHDTRMLVDQLQRLELYQRAGCEGWMDEAVTIERVCSSNPPGTHDEGSIYDFSWESLNHQAHGGRGIGFTGLAHRPDLAEGFGPLPSVKTYAEPFNRLAANLNLMTKARLPVKAKLQSNYTAYTGHLAMSFLPEGIKDEQAPPSADTFAYELGWLDGAVDSRYWCASDPSPEGLESGRHEAEFRVEIDPTWSLCIPPDLLAHVNEKHGGFIARKTTTTRYEERHTTTNLLDSTPCDGVYGAWGNGAGLYYYWDTITDVQTDCTTVPLGTKLQCDAPPIADYRLNASAPCTNSAEVTLSFDPLLTSAYYVSVPLAEYEEPEWPTHPTTSELATAVMEGTPRNNFNGFIGAWIKIGPEPVTVAALGRYSLTGNTGTHALKLVAKATGLDVEGSLASVNMSEGTPGKFSYGYLPQPIELPANAEYYVVSNENNGQDFFLNNDTQVVFDPRVTLMGTVWRYYPNWMPASNPGKAYVPVSMLLLG